MSSTLRGTIPDSIQKTIQHLEPIEATDSLIHLARYYSRTASVEYGAELAKEGLQRAQALNNDSLILKAIYILGSCYEDLGFYRMAIKTYERSFPILEQSGTTRDKGSIYNSLGIALDYLSNYKESLRYYLVADSCFLACDDRVGHANVLNNIGLIHFNQKNYQDARAHFESSLSVARELKSESQMAMAYSNLGMIALEEKDFNSALKYYSACLEIDLAAEPINPNWVGSDYSSLGQIWTMEGNFDSAYHYFSKGINFKRKTQAKRPLITAYHQMAEMLVDAGKTKVALTYVDSAENLASDLEDPLIHLEQFRIRALILRDLGQPAKALELLERFISLNDSLTKAQNYKDGKLLEEEFSLQLRQHDLDEISSKLESEEALNRNFKIGLLVVILLSLGLIWTASLNERKNKKLIIQQAELQEALSVKTRFLSVVSHEIRTPLHVIMGMANSLLQSTKNTESEEAVHALQASALQLTQLVNDILDLNKLEHGSMKTKHAPFSLIELTNTLEAAYSLDCTRKGIQFILERDTQVPKTLLGDRIKLEQVLNNLLNNAVKFTDEGSVRLEIIAQPVDDQKWNIEFIVKDTGIGIPQEDHQKIFQPFFQSDGDMNRNFNGTGLGLAISNSLLELMGSKLSLASQLNSGTTLSFSLLLESANSQTAKTDDTLLSNWSWPSDKRILVAEDYVQNQLLLKMMFAQFKAEASWTENGLECIQEANKNSYDVVLLDINMPVMNGYEAAKILRERFGNKIHIIGLTATNQEEALSEGAEYFDTILYKPFTQQQLESVLKAVDI